MGCRIRTHWTMSKPCGGIRTISHGPLVCLSSSHHSHPITSSSPRRPSATEATSTVTLHQASTKRSPCVLLLVDPRITPYIAATPLVCVSPVTSSTLFLSLFAHCNKIRRCGCCCCRTGLIEMDRTLPRPVMVRTMDGRTPPPTTPPL